MPGIVGIISRTSREKNQKDLGLMIGCMMHEPFYTSGMYVNDKLGLYAGWVCHKNSFSDCMPVFNEKKDLVLLFSGENFADKELTDHLKKQGHEFNASNASYLIHLYEEKGDEFLKSLNGWFSGILVDFQKKKVVLFNDRYGMQRIYYHESKDAFLFSSEAKSLLRVRSELRKIDPESLGEFFTCNCILENRTLFSNIFLMPGGSAWTFYNGNNVKKDYYFKPIVWQNQPILEKETYYKRLKETFLKILPRYFHSKEPIAMSLTGGLDSRMILACRENPPVTLLCYTFDGMYGDSFDVRVARKVADAWHQTYRVVRIGGEFFSDFSNLSEQTIYITDGCLGVCGSHDIYFNRLAREIAPIRMTGKFGSEVLRDRTMFKAISPCERLFHPDFKNHLLKAGRAFDDIKKGHKLSFAVFKEMPWHEFGRLALEQSQLTLRTPYMDNDLVQLIYQAPTNTRASNEIPLRLIEDTNPTLRKIMTNKGIGGESNYLFSKCAQLFYYSLFKAEYIYLYQLPHLLAKLDYIFRPLHLEKLIMGRQKYEHYRIWFRDELSDYVQEILLDKRALNRPYLNKKFLEEMVRGHIKGDRNYTNEINKILTAELIHRFLIEDI